MPVSTFSSDQDRSHGRMLARWSVTRERLTDDERRAITGGLAEMDGTGLHERDNWPLGPSSTTSLSPERKNRRRTASKESNALPRMGDSGETVDGDVLPQVEGIHFEDEEQEEENMRSKAENRASQPNGFLGLAISEDGQSSRAPSDTNQVSEDGREALKDTLERVSTGTSQLRDNSSAIVSDIDSEGKSDASGSAAEHQSHDELRNGHQESPASEQDARVAPEAQRTSEEVSEQSYRGADRQLHNGSANGDYGSQLSDSVHQDEAASLQRESLDVATPLQHSPPLAQTEFRSSGASTPIQYHHINHGRVSSIAKTTPPSRRSSTPNTAYIPHNKDRVRYSWQSLQGDEPNRPRIHIIKLVSNTATASAGFPGGEAFGFSISPSGRRIAAYNSARLFILQTAALPVGISQDFALKRRPHAVEIVDDGSTLAVLADQHTVNIYSLQGPNVKRTRSVKLDYPTTCIALAPTGGLLAAAYEGGIEIFSLDSNALPTDRRAVRSIRMDRLSFSADGSTLLGTTTRINVSSTVVVSVPLFSASESGVPTHTELKEAWCSELLHPENIRNSSHATFMRENRACCNERLYAWNGLADTFGILNTQDLQYGNIDFPVVITPPLSTCGGLGAAIHSCPTIDEHGETVAMIVNDRTIRLYIVPRKLEDNETSIEAHSIDHELDEGYGCPFSEVRWMHSQGMSASRDNQAQVQGRLLVVSPGGVVEPGLPEEALPELEGGRIIMFDFDPQFAGQPGQTFSLTLGKSPPQMLEEEELDAGQAVALVRRRTVNQSKTGSLSQRPITLGRAATTFGRPTARAASPNGGISSNSPNTSYANRRSVLSLHSMTGSDAARSLPDLVEQNETADIAVEEPFSNTAPRAQASLQRAASNLQRHRFQTIEERNQERVSVDSGSTFLALPEYTEEPNAPLPSRYRAMAGLDAPKQYPVRPSVITNVGNTASSPMSEPMTAPVSRSDPWDSEQTFSPVSRVGTFDQQQQVFSPVSRSGTFNFGTESDPPQSATSTMSPWQQAVLQDAASTAPVNSSIQYSAAAPQRNLPQQNQLPRSLQRAYSNAIASGPPPSIIGDWENVSPVGPPPTRPFSPSSSSRNAGGSVAPASPTSISAPSENWDSSATGTLPYGMMSNRYSTSLLNPPGHSNGSLASSHFGGGASISARSLHSSGSGSPTATRRVPPHIQAFRNQASLFPPTQSSDYVPLPLHKQQQRAGNVAHPITAWHPPAPSNSSSSPSSAALGGESSHPPGSRGYSRGHIRRSSSLSNATTARKTTAFASTDRARRMGFFNSKKRGKAGMSLQPGGSGRGGSREGEGGEKPGFGNSDAKSEYTFKTGRSAMTWMSARGKECVVM